MLKKRKYERKKENNKKNLETPAIIFSYIYTFIFFIRILKYVLKFFCFQAFQMLLSVLDVLVISSKIGEICSKFRHFGF